MGRIEYEIGRLKEWIYKHFHQYDDYSVRATKWDDIRENVHTFSTPWVIKAIMKYVYFHFRYPKCTIVFTHHRYKE